MDGRKRVTNDEDGVLIGVKQIRGYADMKIKWL